jgi:hypothetical protein
MFSGNATKIIVIFFLISSIATAAEDLIDSPDQLYTVSPRGIYKTTTEGPLHKDGYYKVNAHLVIPVEGYRAGEHIYRGYWVPSAQQFYGQGYAKVINIPRCNYWTDSSWGYPFLPRKLRISGREVAIYQVSFEVDQKRKPKRNCKNVRINRNTCERVSCNEWEKADLNNFLVKSKKDALVLYESIKE